MASDTGTSALVQQYSYQGNALGVSGIDELVLNPGLNAGRYYLSATPVDTHFRCSDVAGFTLMAEFKPIYRLYLPILITDKLDND